MTTYAANFKTITNLSFLNQTGTAVLTIGRVDPVTHLIISPSPVAEGSTIYIGGKLTGSTVSQPTPVPLTDLSGMPPTVRLYVSPYGGGVPITWTFLADCYPSDTDGIWYKELTMNEGGTYTFKAEWLGGAGLPP